MFEGCWRFCTGETLEIAQEMTIQNGETSMLSNDCENGTAMILRHSNDDEEEDDLAEKKLRNSRHKAEKAKNMKKTQATKSNYARTAAFIVTSSIYGQLLVVVCIAFFTAKIVTPQIPRFYFEAFFLYLYCGSLCFLLYVYIYLLNDVPKLESPRIRNFDSKKSKISETDRSHASIFLRIGSVLFGLGVMIFNGLEFGAYFEIPYSSPCYSVLLGVNPILQAAFTFAQMYFIFTYSRLMIHKFKLIARLGLMHLVGTNICVWLRTLGNETLHELKVNPAYLVASGGGQSANTTIQWSNGTALAANESLLVCQQDSIMGAIMKNASQYLYPFIVEYSLIAAAFLYIMWSTIGKRYSMVYEENCLSSVSCHQVPADNLSSSSRSSSLQNLPSLYSCLGSSKGLFTGFLFLAISVTSLIIFFVLVHHPNYSVMASLLSDISHSVLLVLSSVAILIGFCKTRNLKFQPALRECADSNLRDLLLRTAAFGLYAYSLFGVIAGALHLHTSTQHLLVLVTNLMTIVQVTLQTLFISDVVCRKRSGQKQPGRQLITFLLINNLTLWIIYTFEMQKLESSPIQLAVFGYTSWQIILRITLPLSIFYRFHAAVTLAEIWKNSYKP